MTHPAKKYEAGASHQSTDPRLVFLARAGARQTLVEYGEMTLDEAIRSLIHGHEHSALRLEALPARRAVGANTPAPEISPTSQEHAMTDALRPYQVDIVADVERAIAAGERRILLVAPTGAGKTVIASELITRATRRYRPVLVLGHRLEIITQTSKKLYGCGIRHGIIKAGFSPRPMERVQVASVQTLWVRAMRSDAMTLPPADLLFVDECHHATATTWRRIIEAFVDRIDRHAVPRRRARTGRHLHDHDRVPAGRRADRARLPGQVEGLRPGDA
jgi:hypothetical protein